MIQSVKLEYLDICLNLTLLLRILLRIPASVLTLYTSACAVFKPSGQICDLTNLISLHLCSWDRTVNANCRIWVISYMSTVSRHQNCTFVNTIWLLEARKATTKKNLSTGPFSLFSQIFWGVHTSAVSNIMRGNNKCRELNFSRFIWTGGVQPSITDSNAILDYYLARLRHWSL